MCVSQRLHIEKLEGAADQRRAEEKFLHSIIAVSCLHCKKKFVSYMFHNVKPYVFPHEFPTKICNVYFAFPNLGETSRF